MALKKLFSISDLATVQSSLSKVTLDTDWSSGDRLHFYAKNSPNGVPGQRMEIKHGTSASPVTLIGPTTKVSRTGAVTQAAIEAAGTVGTDGSDQLAAIMGISRGTAAEEVQGVGVTGMAWTESTVGSPGNDACGIYGVGWSKSTSTGALGIGGVFVGRTDSATGKTTSIELMSYNASGADGTLAASGASGTKGIWMNAGGTGKTAVAIQIGHAFNQQFLYGMHANSQVGTTDGLTGGISEAFIRDDSTAKKSVWIRGTHSEGALVIEKDAGFVTIGTTTLTGDTSQLLELHAGNTNRVPIFRITGGGNVNTAIKFNNSSGNFHISHIGGSGSFFTGTAAGDAAIYADPTKYLHIGRSGGGLPDIKIGGGIQVNSTLAAGSGDNVAVYPANNPTAQIVDVRKGTSGSPDTTYGALLKVSRSLSVSESTFSGDGGGGLAAISGQTQAIAGSEGQSIGIFGGATTFSTNVGTHSQADAIGLYGVGRAATGSTRTGIGAFIAGRREDSGGRATAVEISTDNQSATGGVYQSNTYSSTMGIWIHPTGSGDAACGIQFGHLLSPVYRVGIGFNDQSIGDSSIRDDSQATTSIDIRGTHTNSIKLGATAGPADFGANKLTNIGNATSSTDATAFGQLSSYDRTFNLPGIGAPTGTWPGTTLGPAANRAFWCRFVPSRNMTIALIAFAVTTAATADDSCDVGIYDASLNRIVSSGATSGKLNSIGVKTISISSTNLTAGTVYHASFAYGSVGGTGAQIAAVLNNSGFYGDLFGTAVGTRIMSQKDSQYPLPAGPLTTLSGGVCPFLVLRES